MGSQAQAGNIGLTVWTVGHSTRALDDFVNVLKKYDIEQLVDVRRFPGSRRLPQFGAAPLEAGLAAAGIDMKWLPSLGGRRKVLRNSPNSAWRVEAFQGYADHIETEEFAEGFFELLMLAGGARTAIMCAEVLWWRCHRRIIADVLVSLGFDVVHIRDAVASEAHSISPPGRLVDGTLTYASEKQLILL